MTRFALLIWAFEQTGRATTLATLGFFLWTPFVLFSPVAGVLADRYDRRLLIILGDLGAAVMTILVMILFWTNQLEVWHLYLLEAATSMFEVFQAPAFTAATSTLIPKKDFARAHGLRVLGRDTSRILAPLAASTMLVFTDIGSIMVVDVITFSVAMLTLLKVRIPLPKPIKSDKQKQSFIQQITLGFRYISSRKGLLGLLIIFTGVDFFATLTHFAILPVLILSRSNNSEWMLAAVQSALGIAAVLGGIAVITWGLPKQKIHIVLLFTAVSFLFGDFLFAMGDSLPTWILASIMTAFFVPFVSSGHQTIWQVKVPPAVQGRVLSTRHMFQNIAKQMGFLLAGWLADDVFSPAMLPEGKLAPIFGWLVGTDQGAGIALMFVGTAVLGAAICISGYLFPAIRNVETDLPDFDETENITPIATKTQTTHQEASETPQI